MKYVPGNSQDIGSRKNQEDSFGFSDLADRSFAQHGGFLALLADGAGGMQHGGTASRLAVKVFLQAYAAKTEAEEIPAALERCLVQANAAVCDFAESAGASDNVATTLVAAVFFRDRLCWISVGDSALFLHRGGTLSLLTHCHTYARELDRKAELGEISQEAALSDPARDALTSFVGSNSLSAVDRSGVPLSVKPGDRILLASDGLFKSLSDTEIGAELSLQPQRACDALVQKVLAKAHQHQDNVTVLCVGVEAEDEETIRLQPNQRTTPPRRNFWAPWKRN